MNTPKGLILDMDGVVYRGNRAIADAIRFLDILAALPLVFVTNNSSQSPQTLHAKLRRLGIPSPGPDGILTSAVATARHLTKLHPGFRYYAVGGPGLHQALAEAGTEAWENVDFVVVGEGPGLDYESLTLGINLILRGGARLVGTNPDANLDGTLLGRAVTLPGGGALLAAFTVASGTNPLIIGKPAAALYREALCVLGCRAGEAVMIGDRPETDIAGAQALGIPSVLVRSGRFKPGEPYPEPMKKPDWDVHSLLDLPWARK